MSKPALFASVLFIVIPACLGDNPSQQQQGCKGGTANPAQDGTVSSALTLGPDVHNVTVTALDLDANREVTNTVAYPVLDHGFQIDLPSGRYDIEVTDEAHKLVARYPSVEVDGDIDLDPALASKP